MRFSAVSVAPILALFLTTFSFALPNQPIPTRPEVIYGDDNRQDLYQVTDENILRLADSTVALFDSESLVPEDASKPESSMIRIRSGKFLDTHYVCADEPFANQPTPANCSGSLIAPDLILTAGHCVSDADECKTTKVAFGYSYRQKDADPTLVPADEVFGCKEIVGHNFVKQAADWTVFRLDRAVTKHKPLELNRSQETITVGTEVMVIGHPSGLPAKFADSAAVRSVDVANGYFVTNLDTYGGNSGSPVFNATTGLIEGVLVRGEKDFQNRKIEKPDPVAGTPTPGDSPAEPEACRFSNRCESDKCRGEDVTLISEILKNVPELK